MDKDKKKPKVSLWGEFSWFVWGLVGLGVIWFWTGGPSRATSHEGEFIKPLAPINSGEIYGNYYAGKPTTEKDTLKLSDASANAIRKGESAIEDFIAQAGAAKEIHATSLLAKKLSFDGTAGAQASNPNQEYVRIVLSEYAKSPATLSGLVLKGTGSNSSFVIPKAVNKILPNETVTKTDIVLSPGGRALITSGPSPVGASFRLNMCVGYLEQAHDYTPALRKDCPEPVTELALAGLYNDSSCRTFVEKLPRCEAFQGVFPPYVGSACKKFVTENLNYQSCVARHEKDKGFYENEWRVFLGQEIEAWKNSSEIVKLIDGSGKVVDAITY